MHLFAAIVLLTVLGAKPHANTDQGKQQLTPSQIFQKASKLVVAVEAGDKAGTGFFVSPNAICTCFHVVAGASTVTIRYQDGTTETSGSVINVQPDKDIIWLYVTRGEPALPLADYAAVKVGDPLYVIGNPLGLDQTITTGIVSGKRREEKRDLLQLSAGVSHGSSGSPVLNARAEVIGMVTSSLTEGQQLNFAVSAKDLKQVVGVPLGLVSDDKRTLASKEDGSSSKGIQKPKPLTIRASVPPIELVRIGAGGAQGVDFLQLAIDLQTPASMESKISKGDLELFVRATLSEHNIRVISSQEALDSFNLVEDETEEGMLLKTDAYFRTLSISVNAVTDSFGNTSYNTSTRLRRGVLVWPGVWAMATTAEASSVGYFGSAVDANTAIKTSIQKGVDNIVAKIKAAGNGKKNSL